MIKIQYDKLGVLQFQQSVQKLANSTFKDPKAFAVKHITKDLREGFFKMRDEYKNTIEAKYAVKEGDKIQEAKEGTKSAELGLPFQAKDGQEGDVKGALDAFNKKFITIDRKKITPEVLFSVNEWTPRELETLEPIVEEPGESA